MICHEDLIKRVFKDIVKRATQKGKRRNVMCPPIREYKCLACGQHTDNLERNPEDKLLSCAGCGSGNLERVITGHGGYDMASGPSSVRPKQAGSFKVKK